MHHYLKRAATAALVFAGAYGAVKLADRAMAPPEPERSLEFRAEVSKQKREEINAILQRGGASALFDAAPFAIQKPGDWYPSQESRCLTSLENAFTPDSLRAYAGGRRNMDALVDGCVLRAEQKRPGEVLVFDLLGDYR